VYAPYNLEVKKQMWVELLVARWCHVADHWCIIDDFNLVLCGDKWRRVVERQKKAMSKLLKEDQLLFNLLIENLEMEDLPLLGRKFYWVQPNGGCMSKLNIILISNNWSEVWGEVRDKENWSEVWGR
jgi:hypothetical protein